MLFGLLSIITCVSRSWFNNNISWFQMSILFSIFNHSFGNTIFNTTTSIEEFTLCNQRENIYSILHNENYFNYWPVHLVDLTSALPPFTPLFFLSISFNLLYFLKNSKSRRSLTSPGLRIFQGLEEGKAKTQKKQRSKERGKAGVKPVNPTRWICSSLNT